MSDEARVVLRRVVIAGLLVVAGGMLWYSSTIKGEPTEPTLVDSAAQQLVPQPGSTALRQAEIGIDLVPGWDADLLINGVDIPQDEERNVEAENQVFFSPGDGKVIEELGPGRVQVVAIIWRPTAGETRERGSRSVRWSFNVA